MKKYNSKIFNYLWVIYPVCVILIVFLTFRFMVGGDSSTWKQLLEKQGQVLAGRQSATQLSAKLDQLNQVDQNNLGSELAWLDQSTPQQKRIDITVSQLRYAAAVSGTFLKSIKGQVGQVDIVQEASASSQLSLTADYLVADLPSMRILVSEIEKSLPLLKIDSVKYSGTELTLQITSSWYPAEPITVKIDQPLPDYSTSLSQLRQNLSGFVSPDISAIPEPQIPEPTVEIEVEPTPPPDSN